MPDMTTEVQHQDLSTLFNKLPDYHVCPLWTTFMEEAVPVAPKPKAIPHLWSYEKLRPALIEAGRLTSTKEAERRVLMFVNPTLETPHTTDTLFAGLQLILPNEVAPAHRHLPFALRFIIEGNRGFTAVEGEKMMMERGDVILTPTWTWHDHGHEGDGPMIWLDGLDLPLYQAIPVNYGEPYSEGRFPSSEVATSPMKFTWSTVQKSLDAHKGSYAKYIYPFNEVKKYARTIAAEAVRVDSMTASPLRQENASFVCHIYEGTGYTMVGDKRLDWARSDTFVIPAWMPFQHHCTGLETTYIFAFSDRYLLEALGIHRVA